MFLRKTLFKQKVHKTFVRRGFEQNLISKISSIEKTFRKLQNNLQGKD